MKKRTKKLFVRFARGWLVMGQCCAKRTTKFYASCFSKIVFFLFFLLASCATPHPQYGVSTSLSCVPYARQVSGIQLSGDAWQWWDEAAGLYPRTHTPARGAVIVFAPHGNMTQGHLAVVTAVDGARAIRVTQANWLPNRIETNQPVIDVSPYNDWSEVRVWYEPIQAMGATTYPVYGFILPR